MQWLQDRRYRPFIPKRECRCREVPHIHAVHNFVCVLRFQVVRVSSSGSLGWFAEHFSERYNAALLPGPPVLPHESQITSMNMVACRVPCAPATLIYGIL